MTVRIRENTMLAKAAARAMKADKIAIVFGRSIHLHNTSKEEFLQNKRWVRHEIAHVKQFEQHGYIKFIAAYLLESFNKGYEFNKYELEARKKEKDESILNGIILQ